MPKYLFASIWNYQTIIDATSTMLGIHFHIIRVVKNYQVWNLKSICDDHNTYAMHLSVKNCYRCSSKMDVIHIEILFSDDTNSFYLPIYQNLKYKSQISACWCSWFGVEIDIFLEFLFLQLLKYSTPSSEL